MIKQGDIWQSDYTRGKYQIAAVEKEHDGSILNIILKNINSGASFEIGEWELNLYYTRIDTLSKSKQRG